MKELFVTRLLQQDTTGHIDFLDAELGLRPGDGFTAVEEKSILLAGGFPSTAPDSPFLLSPTLQANTDLSTASDADLEKIAHAELAREQAKMYRSYTVDVDARVAVVAGSAESLREFNDTYGGLLRIDCLLAKGNDPEFTAITELSVKSSATQGVSLDYAVRAPINISRCTYCGACGSSCPEKCISPDLYVDFDKCTFCKKCEEICPHEAVEIYGAEYRSLKLPALVVLDGLEIEGADDCNDIYSGETFTTYLQSLYPFQVDEIVSVKEELCHYSDDLGKGCTLCYDSCTHKAISLDGGVHINPLRCEECGDCLAVCPTGALVYERFSDQSFVNYIESIPSIKDKTVVVSDVQNLHQFWWVNRENSYNNSFFLGCEKTEFLSLFHLLFLHAKGASKIVIVKEQDSGRIVERVAKLANTILGALFGGDQPVIVAEKIEEQELQASPKSSHKGEFTLGSWKNRRESQNEVLGYLAGQSGKEPGFKGNHQTPFATVSCDSSGCTQCMSCINVCKIQAMRTDQHEMVLSHKAASCVGCGLCVVVCPERVLEMSRNWQFKKDFFEEGVMAEGEPMKCLSCEKVFGTRKSYEKVMSILAAKESVDTTHFQYCEDCRVIRLFDEANS